MSEYTSGYDINNVPIASPGSTKDYSTFNLGTHTGLKGSLKHEEFVFEYLQKTGKVSDSATYSESRTREFYNKYLDDDERYHLDNLYRKAAFERWVMLKSSRIYGSQRFAYDSVANQMHSYNKALGLDAEDGIADLLNMAEFYHHERNEYAKYVGELVDGTGFDEQSHIKSNVRAQMYTLYDGEIAGDVEAVARSRARLRTMLQQEQYTNFREGGIVRIAGDVGEAFKEDQENWVFQTVKQYGTIVDRGDVSAVPATRRNFVPTYVANTKFEEGEDFPTRWRGEHDSFAEVQYYPNNTNLAKDLRDLDYFFERRLEKTRNEREEDRDEAKARIEAELPIGFLGRVDATVPDNLQNLVDDRISRENLLDTLHESDRAARNELLQKTFEEDHQANIEARTEELERINKDYDFLINSRKNLNDPFYRALREKGQRNILDQEKQAMRQARLSSNVQNQRGNKALEAEILQGSQLARAALERDLAIEARTGLENLTGQAAQARDKNLAALENLRLGQSEQESNLLKTQSDLLRDQVAQREAVTQRKEDVIGSIRQDQLNRELLNMGNINSETFGRLAAEETGVSQGIAERTGVGQQLIAESNLTETRRHQKEQEKINRMQAANAANNTGGGGGSYLCTAMYLRGEITKELLDFDYHYSFASNLVSDDVRRGYCWFAAPLAKTIIMPDIIQYKGLPNFVLNFNYDISYKLSKGIVLSWANKVAYLGGYTNAKKTSFWMNLVHYYGLACCSLIGKLLKWGGKKEIVSEDGWDIIEKLWNKYYKIENKVSS